MGYQKDEHDTKFYRAIRKYGKENFIIEKIDESDNQEDLDEKEFYWINYYNSVNNGYNTKNCKGKCGGDTLSNHPNKKQISEKIRKSKIGNKNPMRIYGGLKGSKNGMYGKRGKEVPSHKECVAVNIKTNEAILFDTLSDLKEYYNVTTLGMVSNRCSGKTKSDYNGYKFLYKDDYDKSATTIESIADKSVNKQVE